MLYVTRKPGESVMINDTIRVTFVEMKGKQAKLMFEFPKEMSVLRQEVYDRILEENKRSAKESAFLENLYDVKKGVQQDRGGSHAKES